MLENSEKKKKLFKLFCPTKSPELQDIQFPIRQIFSSLAWKKNVLNAELINLVSTD